MSRIERQKFEASLDDPLLIFKVGVLGCAPLDFMGELADAYGAEYLSSDETRLDIMGEREEEENMPGSGSFRDVDTREIRARLMEGARTALSQEQDVVLDMFFNTANSRSVPTGLAREAGAKSIAIFFNAPFTLCEKRVRQWTHDGSFLIPLSQWSRPPISAARQMRGQVERPAEIEGIDHVFHLGGLGDTETLLEKYDDRLARAGLLDRYDEEGGTA